MGRATVAVTGRSPGAASADERDLAARVASLSLAQKVRLLTGADFWSLHAETAVGLRRVVLSDGPAGVRGEHWDEREPSANVPSPTALAATWDVVLVEEIGALLASEARSKGVDVVLAPTVNLHRTPYAGRHFESFSEDPLLCARIGVAFVRGLQSHGVAATLKHFVANDSETQRMTVDVRVDERTLRELYLAPFEAAVCEARAWAVMASYNGVNGQPLTQNPLLREFLHGELGFDGIVMSDWFATYATEASAQAALDLVMPGPGGPWGDALLAAVRRGDVDATVIDDKVLRILRLAARVGALQATAAPSRPGHADAEIAGALGGAAETAGTLRRAAAAGFVLVRNAGDLLPLDSGAIRTLAIVGPNAAVARTQGGGSATVYPPYTVSPLHGLRDALGPGVQVVNSVGVSASSRVPVARSPWLGCPGGGDGVELRFVSADGTVLGVEHRLGATFRWTGRLPYGDDVACIEVHAVVRATHAGPYAIAASGTGRYRLSVGAGTAFDVDLTLPRDADAAAAMMVPPQAVHSVELERGETIEIILAHALESPVADAGASFSLGLGPPYGGDDREIERAVALAAGADAAIVVVGTTEEVESEGFDRTSLSLPGRQDELVARVAAANPRTVAVVNAGAPVLLPWAERVPAVLLAWFAGQEFGHALADVLTGHAEPGGRLPTTWPRTEDGLPTTMPVDGVLRYDEGLFIGYRGVGRTRPAPLYPFGHGLGYSSWTYAAIDAPGLASGAPDAAVTVTLRNLGQRRSKEVVQLYASRPASHIERPRRWLVGFAAAEAGPGQEIDATVRVARRAFEHWDVANARWALEPGSFQLCAGPSSAVLPLTTWMDVG